MEPAAMPLPTRPPAAHVVAMGVRVSAATPRARALVVRRQELAASRCPLRLRRGTDSLMMSRCWPRWMDGGHGHDEVGVDFRSC